MRVWSSETKAQLALKLAKDMNTTKESVHNYFGNKRKMKENVGTLFDKVGDILKNGMEKAKVLSAFFVSVFTWQGLLTGLWGSLSLVSQSEGVKY